MEALTVRGLFVTVEGGEGVGKSTQARALAERFRHAGRDVLETREPGGTPVGDRIRSLLLDPDAEMAPRTELFLYEASRAELTATVIAPALDRGTVVVCDRFYDSTTAYQAFGRGLDRAEVEALNLSATGGLRPDVTVLLTADPSGGSLDVEATLRRATHGGADRMERESLDFHRRVHEGFLTIAGAEPERFVVVDASGTVDEVAAAVWAALSCHLAVRDVPGGE
ncbi:MAG: dTMP kinase [Coriobacteriia bacterium]|nr:dTMP kinase [Coriobacteriia bacterium]